MDKEFVCRKFWRKGRTPTSGHVVTDDEETGEGTSEEDELLDAETGEGDNEADEGDDGKDEYCSFPVAIPGERRFSASIAFKHKTQSSFS